MVYDILLAVFCLLVFMLISTIYKCVKKYKELKKSSKYLYGLLLQSDSNAVYYYNLSNYYYSTAMHYKDLLIESEKKLKTAGDALSEKDKTSSTSVSKTD